MRARACICSALHAHLIKLYGTEQKCRTPYTHIYKLASDDPLVSLRSRSRCAELRPSTTLRAGSSQRQPKTTRTLPQAPTASLFWKGAAFLTPSQQCKSLHLLCSVSSPVQNFCPYPWVSNSLQAKRECQLMHTLQAACLCCAAVYFVQGILGLARLAISFFYKDEFHLDPAAVCAQTYSSCLPVPAQGLSNPCYTWHDCCKLAVADPVDQTWWSTIICTNNT